MTLQRAEKYTYWFALALTIYMPLHIFLSQSLSLVTGGLEAWKAGKDIILVLAAAPLLLIAFKQQAHKSRFFRRFVALSASYAALYALFLFFDKNADTKASITASVYNCRILGYFLLGYVVANSTHGKQYAKSLLKVALIMCLVVASFGILQYFLPKDFLTHFGYSLARGVKPMFFIDDKPDFPRVMSTLRDPNSLAAFLALPITYSIYYLHIKKENQTYKVLSDTWLRVLLASSTVCLLFTYSRSGVITVFVSLVAVLVLSIKNKRSFAKKYAPVAVVILVIAGSLLFIARNTYTVQNLLFHADKSTVEVDPNQLRLDLYSSAVTHISDYPFGEGPGTAGIVSLGRTRPAVLTENYYLQIAYEVGILGLLLFLAISILVLVRLYMTGSQLAIIILSTGVGIAAFGLLNHSWSNEALALQWWLLAGLAIPKPKTNAK